MPWPSPRPLTLGHGAWADEAAAKKWIDSEFQPSTLSKDQQMAEMKWFIEAAKKLQGQGREGNQVVRDHHHARVREQDAGQGL
jgi:glycerol transport system substrate-binding protein